MSPQQKRALRRLQVGDKVIGTCCRSHSRTGEVVEIFCKTVIRVDFPDHTTWLARDQLRALPRSRPSRKRRAK